MSNQSKVIEILKKSNWSESMKLEKSEIIKLIEKEGYEVFPKAVEFLQSFLNIKFFFKPNKMELIMMILISLLKRQRI